MDAKPELRSKGARTWKKGETEKRYDDWGNALPDENPLASYRGDFVWESDSLDHPVTVILEKPLKRFPPNSSAHGHHEGQHPKSAFQYYSRMRVINEQGKSIEFDLNTPNNDVAVLQYDQDESGEEILIYADVLGIYTFEGEPWIEHGYLYDRPEIVRDKPCASFLRRTERELGPITETELVNSIAIYHSPAEFVQGTANVRHGLEDDLPLGVRRCFFWRRAIDISDIKAVPASRIGKMLRLPVPVPHPANQLRPNGVLVSCGATEQLVFYCSGRAGVRFTYNRPQLRDDCTSVPSDPTHTSGTDSEQGL